MKKIIFFLLFPIMAFAQVPQTQPVIYTSTGTISIGSGVVANSKSLLDLTSTTKGFLAPRMTTTQRDAISSPATGLQIYNTTTNAINFYNGSSWVAVGTGSGTVTSVGQSFTGGLISVGGTPVTTSGTLALTVAGTSGGIPYFSSGSTWASSNALTQYGIVIGGGAGAAPTTPTGLTYSSSTLYSPLIDVGASSSAAGVIYFRNATNSFSQGIRGSVAPANIIYNLPSTEPTSGQMLSSTAPSAGVATLSWATPSSGITQGTTTIASGSTGNLGINLAGVYSSATAATARGANIDQASPYNVGLGYQTFSSGSFSGSENVSIGYQSGLGLTTATQNTFLGTYAGYTLTTGIRNTGIGYKALYTAFTSTTENTAVGFQSGGGNSGSGTNITGTGNTFLGYAAGQNWTTGTYSVVIGHSAAGTTATQGVAIGYLASISTYTASIAIGANATATANRQIVLGGSYAGGTGPTSLILGTGDSFTSNTTAFTIRCSDGSGSNNVGQPLTTATGASTGNSIAPDLKYQTSVKGASGSTVQTLGDRYSIVGKYTDLTESSATAFVRINCPTSTVTGGTIIYTVEANDATDFQALTGSINYSIVNKAGTSTIVLSTDTQASSTSTGTLTGTITASDSGSGNIDFKMNAVSSLTQTVLRINCQVIKNFGTGSITAQ